MKAFTREELERREHEFLAEEAAFSDRSQGRMIPEKPDAVINVTEIVFCIARVSDVLPIRRRYFLRQKEITIEPV